MFQSKDRVADWIKNKTHLYAAYKRLISELKTHTQTEGEGLGKDISCKRKRQERGSSNSHITKNTLKQSLYQKTNKGII